MLEVLALVTPGAADEPPVSADLNPRAAALIAAKCVSCHGTDEPQGGLNLTSLPFALGDRAVRARWIRIHDRVDHGEMPPDEGDLTDEQRQDLVATLAVPLHDADASDVAQFGRGSMRRLKRDEYQQNLRDVLVNNAAIQPPSSCAPLHEFPTELWERMVGVNFTGYSLLAKHALREMLKQDTGVIVNIASGQAHRTTRGVPAYGPIKAANLLQTRQWGVEYAREGIRVVSVSPSAIRTQLVEATLHEQGGEAQLANRHPLGRIGRSDEVAAAVLWVASDDASFVTATDLEVDGGLGAFGAFADPYPMSRL